MSEMLFMTLILLCILVFIKLNESPTLLWAITSGITCSAASHCRQLALPFFLAALAILIFRTRKRGAVLSAVAILTLLLCNMPWSLRNLNLHGSYTISSHLGPNIFTKLTSYRLENAKGRWYGKIEPVYSNVLKDLGLSGYKAPDHPEEAWQVNRIPHALSDSLKKYHGYTYPQAGNLMLKVSLEGFVSKPADYIRSIGKTMYVLVFQHMELYPFPNHAFPLPKAAYNILFFRQVATGASHISGLFIVMFPLVFFLRHKNSILLIIPFTILLIGYLTTAAVHVGFTRYTIPWIPYSAICAAYVIEFLVLRFFTVTQKSKV
jgi:4-amino-4-deoxy-L-arabinose transferase-like glycosyltransferase